VSHLGRPRVHLRRTDSTNDRARELATAGAPHGTLVTTAEQSAGRGRHGRRWEAPSGSSLLASLLLRSPPQLLPLLAAVATCDVVGEQALIKWPNDIVLVRGGPAHPLAKLAGILVEARPQEGWAVLGIGLNVAVELKQLPSELRATAATLGRSVEEVEPTLGRLLQALSRRLGDPAESVLEAWRARDALRGRMVAWGSGADVGGRGGLQRGRAQGIDGEGRLVVELLEGGRTALSSGEVHLQVGQ
jgi:BirA family biotin operon repressor/biotin-[acetyl-CoA-carboxylase] ligase